MDLQANETLSISGRVKMSAAVFGPPDGLPVLALHGWLDNAGSFAELGPLLHGCRIIALDLPGHGCSEALPAGLSYHFLDHLEDIHAALEAFPGPPLRLIGHSMGGALALVYAAAFPERVGSVVSIDALGPLAERADATAERIRKAVLARSARLRQGRVHASREAAIEARVGSGQISARGAAWLAQRGLEETQGGWRWSADRRHYWPSINRLTETQVEAILDEVDCPVLLVEASDSPLRLPETVAQARYRSLRDVRVVRIPGGHHVHLDKPEPVAAAILSFWSDLADPAVD